MKESVVGRPIDSLGIPILSLRVRVGAYNENIGKWPAYKLVLPGKTADHACTLPEMSEPLPMIDVSIAC